jgi:Family of unknown function (DUF5994)
MHAPREIMLPANEPPRVRLNSIASTRTLLDGGWWPRSTDPNSELPGLIRGIDHLRGSVRRMVLSADGWDTHPSRIHVDNRTVHLGYFASQPVALLTALCDGGSRVDLLVVSPGVAAETAESAMTIAATTNNIMPAQAIVSAAGTAVQTSTERLAEQVWETDGGDPRTIRPRTIYEDHQRMPGVLGHSLTV